MLVKKSVAGLIINWSTILILIFEKNLFSCSKPFNYSSCSWYGTTDRLVPNNGWSRRLIRFSYMRHGSSFLFFLGGIFHHNKRTWNSLYYVLTLILPFVWPTYKAISLLHLLSNQFSFFPWSNFSIAFNHEAMHLHNWYFYYWKTFTRFSPIVLALVVSSYLLLFWLLFISFSTPWSKIDYQNV